jgi:hypothetical protein
MYSTYPVVVRAGHALLVRWVDDLEASASLPIVISQQDTRQQR